jgi:hypothetical protein
VKHLIVVVDWYGPYKYQEAIVLAKSEYGDGLYLCVGKTKHQRGSSVLQYVGITGKELGSRVNANHHKLTLVTRDCEIWLGEVGSLGVPGPKTKKTNPALDFAEWALVYFLKPALNAKKIKSPPTRPVTVLNRWWKTDFETPWIRKRPHLHMPDLIDYLGQNFRAKIVRFKDSTRVKM